MQDALPTSFGIYRVIRLLGRGGMGEVYEVEHPQLGVHYALKAFARETADADAEKLEAHGIRLPFWLADAISSAPQSF